MPQQYFEGIIISLKIGDIDVHFDQLRKIQYADISAAEYRWYYPSLYKAGASHQLKRCKLSLWKAKRQCNDIITLLIDC